MKKLLWLDDIRNPFENDWLVLSPIEQPFDVSWVKSYPEFVKWRRQTGIEVPEYDGGELLGLS
jgi:hypothetical protein